MGIIVKDRDDVVSRLEAAGIGTFLKTYLIVPEWTDGTMINGTYVRNEIKIPIAITRSGGVEIEVIEVGMPNSGRYANLEIPNGDYEFDHIAFLERASYDEKCSSLTQGSFSKNRLIGSGKSPLLQPILYTELSYFDIGDDLAGLVLEVGKYEVFNYPIHRIPDWMFLLVANVLKFIRTNTIVLVILVVAALVGLLR